MSTVNLTTGQQTTNLIGTAVVHAEAKIDFAANNVLQSDVVQCLKIPANANVLNVWVRVLTAEGGTCTATVGDGAGANSWDASTNLNAAVDTVTGGVSGTDAYAAIGKFYASEDTIDLTMGHNTDAAIVVVSAVYTMSEY